MSNDSNSSLSSKLWGIAGGIAALVVAVWLAVKLLAEIWIWLVIVLGVVGSAVVELRGRQMVAPPTVVSLDESPRRAHNKARKEASHRKGGTR